MWLCLAEGCRFPNDFWTVAHLVVVDVKLDVGVVADGLPIVSVDCCIGYQNHVSSLCSRISAFEVEVKFVDARFVVGSGHKSRAIAVFVDIHRRIVCSRLVVVNGKYNVWIIIEVSCLVHQLGMVEVTTACVD